MIYIYTEKERDRKIGKEIDREREREKENEIEREQELSKDGSTKILHDG